MQGVADLVVVKVKISQEYRDCYQQKYEHFLGPVVVSRSIGATVFCL